MNDKLFNILNDYSDKIFKFSKREPWSERVEDISDIINKSLSDGLDMDVDDCLGLFSFNEVFISIYNSLVEGFLFDSFYDDIDDNILKAYIDKNKYRIPDEHKELLNSIRKQNFSIYKVIKKEKNGRVILQDMVLNTKPVEVENELFSNRTVKGNYWFTKVIKFENKYYHTDVCLYLDINDEKAVKYIIKKMKNELKIIDLPDLSEYELVPESCWQKVKIVMNKYMLDSCLIGFIPMCQFLLIENIGEKRMYYNIKNETQVIKILNNMQEFNIVKNKDEENSWDYLVENEDGEMIDIAGIDINDNKLYCSTFDNEILPELNKLLKTKLENNVSFAVFENDDEDY